jgi:hypothetical protein
LGCFALRVLRAPIWGWGGYLKNIRKFPKVERGDELVLLYL